MNGAELTRIRARERHRVVAVILVSLLAVTVTAVFVLQPVYRRCTRAARNAAEVRRQLVGVPRAGRSEALRDQLQQLVLENGRLRDSWEQLRSRVDTFRGRAPVSGALSSADDGRIDFKVALFEARQRLEELAAERNAAVPGDLGMEETIAADEDAETRLWQLAAAFKLAEQSVQQGIPVVERIEPLEPLRHELWAEESEEAREFPVRTVMRCSFDQLSGLVDVLIEEGNFFALRGFRAEICDAAHPGELTVQTIYGGSLFQLRHDLVPATEDGASSTRGVAP